MRRLLRTKGSVTPKENELNMLIYLFERKAPGFADLNVAISIHMFQSVIKFFFCFANYVNAFITITSGFGRICT